MEPAGLLGTLVGTSPISLIEANSPNDPCLDDGAGLTPYQPLTLDLDSLLSLRANLLYARTDGGKHGFAGAGVADLTISTLGITITAEILTAETTAGPCPSTALSGESTVVRVRIDDGLPLTPPIIVDVTKGQEHKEIDINALLPLLDLGDVLVLHLNELAASSNQVTARALWLESSLLGNVIVAEATSDVHGNPCPTKPPKPPARPEGFMTGGGWISSSVSHGGHLTCAPADKPNNLQVNWSGGRFHLESVSTSACYETGANQGNPAANFDTIVGTGYGRCNGRSGYKAEWTEVDAGEPGTSDFFSIKVYAPPGSDLPACGINASGVLQGGNHQAHGNG
ncbi:MAG: hypothetical protein ACRD0N_00080 [Acidimicrobiales bacterium]